MTKEEYREYYRAWYAKNKDSVKKKNSEWTKKNPDKVRTYHKKTYERYHKHTKHKVGELPQNEREIWKDINEWYCISNQGRTWSWKTGKIMKASANKSGYLYVTLDKKSYSVHRLVAESFVPNPNNYPEVDHIDTDKTNNVWTNLRWTDRKGNQNNPITVEKFKSIGQSNFGDEGDASRPVRQYSLDGKFMTEYSSIKEAAENLGIGRTGIGNTCHHRQHTTGGFRWEFAENVLNDCNIAS